MSFPRRALISTSDKTGVDELAKRLVALGFEILSTGGTAALLSERGVPVTRVSDYTGAPEILSGRVKSLHPRIHGGLLGRPDNEADRSDMEREEIGPIELVAVNLYPFRETVARGASMEEAVENIDIGGPAMIRASAKNFENVAVLVDPADYDQVAGELESGGVSRERRYSLACKAFAHTASYDAAVASYLGSRPEPEAEPLVFPSMHASVYEKAQDLRYGENPHQRAAFYVEGGTRPEPLIGQAVQLQGKELSFNNILDADAALELCKEFDDTAAVVIKHTNPCGVAVDSILAQAYRKARACDEVSAFGGVVALGREVDLETAEALSETFLEIVVAPGFSDEALGVLSSKKSLRLLALSSLDAPRDEWRPGGYDTKKVGGGLLVQDRNMSLLGDENPRVVTERAPTEEEWSALRFGWKVAKHVKSNAIVYAHPGQLVGVGAGQMSRVDSCRIGIQRAVLPIEGASLASDAFFPFRDGIDIAAEAGVKAVIQPGGSARDEEAIAAANEHGMAMVFTGMRHFKH